MYQIWNLIQSWLNVGDTNNFESLHASLRFNTTWSELGVEKVVWMPDCAQQSEWIAMLWMMDLCIHHAQFSSAIANILRLSTICCQACWVWASTCRQKQHPQSYANILVCPKCVLHSHTHLPTQKNHQKPYWKSSSWKTGFSKSDAQIHNASSKRRVGMSRTTNAGASSWSAELGTDP